MTSESNATATDQLATAQRLIASVLEVPEAHVPGDATLDTLEAWDSLGHLRIVQKIEGVIGSELSGEQVVSIDSVQDVARLLAGE